MRIAVGQPWQETNTFNPFATVQPWLDIPELGSSVVMVSDGDGELAR